MQNRINLESNVFQNKEIPTALIDNELGLMNVDKSKYYSLDEIGIEIWNLIEKSTKVNDVVDKLLKEYDIEKKQCEEDVLELISELYEHDLIIKG